MQFKRYSLNLIPDVIVRPASKVATNVLTFCMAGIVVLSGCTTSLRQWKQNGFKVGPNYNRPVALVESDWIDYAVDDRVLQVSDDSDMWWHVFNDPVLDDLIETASESNLTLRTVGTRITQAQAVRGIAAGNLFPQVQQMFGGYDRVQVSRNIANSAPIKHFDQWDTGANLSWEIDFWGRYRRSLESADSALDASVEGYDNVLVLLLADVASSYVQIRTLQEELRLVNENVALQKESLRIADAQFQSGAADQSDVLQLRNNVQQTESLIPALEASLRQSNNALCILLGLPPQDLVAQLGTGPIPTAPKQVAVGMPAELLRRRPDIRQAERLVAAQSAQIGVAEAELYPAFGINGVLNWQADTLDGVFSPGSLAGSVGTGFSWNILNYGRIRNSVLLQDAKFQETVFSYQETVLKAQREAEDAIVGFLKSQDQTDKLQLAVADISELNDLLLVQANAGATDFNRVFVVQSQLTAQQDSLATSRGAIALNLIQIYRSLGGGWQIRLQPTSQPFAANVQGGEADQTLIGDGLISDPVPQPIETIEGN
ncbi:Toluene efflux pump outer membrane protein TtgF precursor [Roseimaritima multifibrata]|uniref:Toluene efflux pump outer membrane protein TtgF n=1 Tax=Roseimaritima multifibrata TaxID=1930274 RepID=A0A517MCE2_9BACT|nr:efflux transporter outer membrane subunit [Roseimaritima multifibrata]QDS92437.1 Toluene efflux pump outer membrane protein TtgF precursor [Roseimaritima multifibrata]